MNRLLILILSIISTSYVSAQDAVAIMKLSDKLADNKIEIAILKKQIIKKNEEIDSLTVLNKNLKSENDFILKNGPKIEAKIFKQCLLYPLERRYSSKFIAETKECLEILDFKKKSEYKEYYKVYLPLLYQYSKFNNQVIDVLNIQIRKRLEVLQWKVNASFANKCIEALQSIEYYKYYQNRNKPPYQSIIYLDNAIDDVIALLKEGGTLNKQRYQNIIDKLMPKD